MTMPANILLNQPTECRGDEENHKVPELGVMFKDLRVIGQGAVASYQSTIASVLNPLNLFKTINTIRHPPTKVILSGFEGVVRPGEMLCKYLVLTFHLFPITFT